MSCNEFLPAYKQPMTEDFFLLPRFVLGSSNVSSILRNGSTAISSVQAMLCCEQE